MSYKMTMIIFSHIDKYKKYVISLQLWQACDIDLNIKILSDHNYYITSTWRYETY